MYLKAPVSEEKGLKKQRTFPNQEGDSMLKELYQIWH